MVSSYFTSSSTTASLNNVVVLLLLLFASMRVIEATVYIPESQLSYQSMPALFGRFWPHDVTYWAHLQMIPSRPYLCPMELETEKEEEVYFEDEDYYYGNDSYSNSNSNRTKVEGDDANRSLDDDVTIPSDGMPIVLLAKRGKCTFYDKSIIASQYKHVDFLIVYDDDPLNNKLIPMTISNSFDSTTTDNDELSSNPNPINSRHHHQQHNHSTIDNQLSSRNHNHHQQHSPPQRHSHLGLLFVSYHAGIELQDIILKRLNDPPYSKYKNYSSHSIHHDDEGIVIQMDGNAPPLAGYQSGFGPASSLSSSSQLTTEGYLWAGTFGFVAFLILFACALLCANLGIIHATTDEFGRLVLITGARSNNGADQGASVKTLLTKDDVLSLDFETYNQQEEPSNDENNDQQDESDQGQDTMMNVDDSPFCCAICLDDEFLEGETIRILPCGHKFHDDCVVPWLTERSPSCPLCKFDVLKHLDSPAIKKQHHSTTTLSANITDEEETATVTTEQEQEGDMGVDNSEDDSQEIVSGDDARNGSTTIWDSFISFSSSRRFDGGGWTLLRNGTGRIPQDDDGSDNSNLENDYPSEIEMQGTISTITSTTTNSSRIPSFPFASNV